MVALLVLLAWGYRLCADWGRSGGLGARARNRGVIEIVARQALTPKNSVYLLRVGDRVLIVGLGADGLRTLDVVVEPDAAARLLGRAAAGKTSSATTAFRETLATAEIEFEEPPTKDQEPAAKDEDPAHITRVRARLAEALARLKAPTSTNGRSSA